MRICLDPGHGGRDFGAVGYVIEKEIVLDVCKRVISIAKKRKEKFDLILTRTEDKFVSLQRRCEIANENNCDYFISVHCNSYESDKVSGVEVFCFPDSEEGYLLALNILKAISKHFKQLEFKGLKEYPFYVLKCTKMPSALINLAFVSNQKDGMLLSLAVNRELFALSIVEGIENTLRRDG